MKRLKVGDIVRCEVSGITDYGVFVKTANNYKGLIHISEISDKFVSCVEKLYILGDNIDAKIMEIDEEKKQLKLSIKGNNIKNTKKKKLEEKGGGFKPLKDNLDIWVKEKLIDLENTQKSHKNHN